jgi:hypothetical protein
MIRKLKYGNQLPENIIHNNKKYQYASHHPIAFWEFEKAKQHKKEMTRNYPDMEYVIIPYNTGIKTNPKVWGVYMRKRA